MHFVCVYCVGGISFGEGLISGDAQWHTVHHHGNLWLKYIGNTST